MLGKTGGVSNKHLPGYAVPIVPVRFIDVPAAKFIVTVDTEEEFDWNAPFRREGYGTRHIRQIGRFQNLCDEFGVSPIYLIDYPVASDPESIDVFNGILAAGKCEIGAQLHAWVTPPHDEEINTRNSYACNLPEQLERQKIKSLFGRLEQSFGSKPLIYRAGRYGAGAHTVSVLHELGVRIDSSVRSLFDYSRQEGPDFRNSSLHPYWLAGGELFELPLTSVFAGLLRAGGQRLFGEAFESETARAFLARTKLLERIALTPEGIPLDRAIEAIDIAIDLDLPVLNFSFHSPSLEPGHTPYVRNQADLDNFYAWWRGVFAHLHRRGVAASTAQSLIDSAS